MIGLNNFNFIGHLTHDPKRAERKEGGGAVLNFSIAVNYAKDKDPNYFDMTAYGEKAEIWEKSIRRGSRVFVAGFCQNNRWIDKHSSVHREIRYVVEKLIYLDPPPPRDGGDHDSHSRT